jgi:hypothetical protein
VIPTDAPVKLKSEPAFIKTVLKLNLALDAMQAGRS